MEKQIGLNVKELERIFAQIKRGTEMSTDKLYNSYLDLINSYSYKFKLDSEKVQDLYDDVFTYMYNNIIQGLVQPDTFTRCFENVLAKQCIKAQAIA